MTATGKRTDDGSVCTLLVINEAEDSWLFHDLGAPGVKLPKADTVALADSILERVR